MRVKLDRKVRYELDGGDRKKVKSFKVDVEPGAITVCVPRAAQRREWSEMKTDVGIGSEDLGDKAKREGDELARREAARLARAGGPRRPRASSTLIIGVLALKLALGDGGKATNQQGALKTIAHQSFGKTLLVLVAIGLAGYALWRLIRAAVGHGAEQRDSAFDRVAALASGIAYGILCVTAIEILTGSGTRLGDAEGDDRRRPRLVGRHRCSSAIAGAILIGVAVYQAYKGLAKKFLDDAKTGEMSEGVREGLHRARRLRASSRGRSSSR